MKQVSDALKGYSKGVHKCLASNRKRSTGPPIIGVGKKQRSSTSSSSSGFGIPRLCVAGGRTSFNCMRDGSVVIDLSELNTVKYQPNSSSTTSSSHKQKSGSGSTSNYTDHNGIHYRPYTGTVTIGGGTKIEDVDSLLSEYGQMAILPTYPNLGVVGSILAGGVGYGSRKYGLACDNVLEATIVLANGRYKICSNRHDNDSNNNGEGGGEEGGERQFQELLWGICGGGGGLGIVVSLTLKTYPIRHAALLTYDLNTSGNVNGQQERRMIVRYWARWITGEVDNHDSNVDGTGPGTGTRTGSRIGGGSLSSRTSSKHKPIEIPHLEESSPAVDDVFSQITLFTNSNTISFLGTSMDVNRINQTDGHAEYFAEVQKKKKSKMRRKNLLGLVRSSSANSDDGGGDRYIPDEWKNLPSLNDLIAQEGMFGVTSHHRKHVQFQIVKYADTLQRYSSDPELSHGGRNGAQNCCYEVGNVFSATKYAKTLSNAILEVLIQATGTIGPSSPSVASSKSSASSSTRSDGRERREKYTTTIHSPRNESKIIIMAMGGHIAHQSSQKQTHNSSFPGRDMGYLIYIEGKWSESSSNTYASTFRSSKVSQGKAHGHGQHGMIDKEKHKVKQWVHSIVRKLHLLEGVQSSVVPEAMRDLVSKSGNTKPPKGWYNFGEWSGRKLDGIKGARDPRNVFSFASRVSWSRDPVRNASFRNAGLGLGLGRVGDGSVRSMASESVASDNDNDSVAMSAAAGVSVSASGKVNVNVASNEKSTSLRSIGGNIVNAITNANASITASIRSTNTDMDSLAQILDSDSDGEEDNDNATICTDIQEAESVKEGEIQPTDCLTPQRHARRKYGSNGVGSGGVGMESAAPSGGLFDMDDGEDGDGFEITIEEEPTIHRLNDNAIIIDEDDNDDDNDNDNEVTGSSPVNTDVQRLLNISDSDEELRDWSLAPVPLQRSDFHGLGGSSRSNSQSPHSHSALEEEEEDDSVSF